MHGELLVSVVLGVFVTVGIGALFVYIRRRIRWGWGLLSDGVAVATTRHPGPLVHGLRRVASHNGDPVPTKAWLGQGDPYWVVPVRTPASSTMSSNGKMISQSSTELLIDGELLMRASLVETVSCRRAGGQPIDHIEVRTDPLLAPDMGYTDQPLVIGPLPSPGATCARTTLYGSPDHQLVAAIDDGTAFVIIG